MSLRYLSGSSLTQLVIRISGDGERTPNAHSVSMQIHTPTWTVNAATVSEQIFYSIWVIATVDKQQRATEGWAMKKEQSSIVAEALAVVLEGCLMLYKSLK